MARNFSFQCIEFKVCQHWEPENSFLSGLWELPLVCSSGKM